MNLRNKTITVLVMIIHFLTSCFTKNDSIAQSNELKKSLYLAVENNQKNLIEHLISTGADPNVKNSMGNTPFSSRR